MRVRIPALAVSALLLGAVSGPVRAEDASTPNLNKIGLYRRIRSTTAKVTADFRNGSVSTGTGVATMACGGRRQIKLIVTNAHVVTLADKTTGVTRVAPSVTVTSWSKDGGVTLQASILYCELNRDSSKDLAYLLVEDPDGAFRVAERATEHVHVGDSVYACGNPQGEEFLIDDGHVLDGAELGLDADEAEKILCHDALTERGNSGGGLFNALGQLVGINTWLLHGRIGMAQTVAWYFANHRFSEYRGALTGAVPGFDLDEVVKGQAIRAAVVGTYRCEPSGAWMNGAGVAGMEGKRRYKEFPFGSVVMIVGEQRRAFGGAYPGTDGRPVTYPRVAICEESSATGRLQFRLNDDNPFDNEWGKDFEVVYLIRGSLPPPPPWRQQLDFGLEVTAPTALEIAQHKLWVTGSDARSMTRFEGGAKVTAVRPGSAAEAWGLRVGDYIVALTCRAPGSKDSDPRDRRPWEDKLMSVGDPVDAGNLDQVLRWAVSTHPYLHVPPRMLPATKLTVVRPGMADDPIMGRYHDLAVDCDALKK